MSGFAEKNADALPNTPAQVAAHEANEKAAALEITWDLYQVELSGDEVEWVARPNPTYWNAVEDPNTGQVTHWEPKAAHELPAGASLHPETGSVVMKAQALVQCRARNEDHAKMLAMRDNPSYHTVDKVTNLSSPTE